jgi:hypothetical protein
VSGGDDGLKSPVDWRGSGVYLRSDTWPGLAVRCDVCRESLTPVMRDDGWRLPVHHWWSSDHNASVCPGSLGGVDTPVTSADRMADRIEAHVVAAMPPPPAEPHEEH